MKSKGLGLIGLFLVAMLAIAIIIFPFWNFSNDHKYTVTITGKERVTRQTNDGIESKYLVYCEDENGKNYVFENTDTVFRGKFNSSDVYGALKEDKTYELTVIGFRVPIFSWYENVIDYKEVENE